MATAKQIAARKKFAERARSGELARMRKKATRKSNPSKKYYSLVSRASLQDGWAFEFGDYDREAVMFEMVELKRANRNLGLPFLEMRVIAAGPSQKAINEAIDKLNQASGAQRKRNPAKTVSQEISQQMRKGKPQKQAVAIALEMERAGKLKKNPMSLVAETIYRQLGANKFVAMTGAKNFVYGENSLMFSIPRNASPFNKVRIQYIPGRDTYEVEFAKVTTAQGVTKSDSYDDVYADQLQELFRMVTGLETSLGTMGRSRNPTATRTTRSRTKLMQREKNPKGRVRFTNIAGKNIPEFKVAYAVHLADRPSNQSLSIFTKKADAIEAAQEVANRTEKNMAVSRVQIYFGNA